MAGPQFQFDIDPDNVLRRRFTELELKNLPFAVMQAANNTAFAVRQEWARRMPQVFDRPTPLTQKAVLYRKATKQKPGAEIYIRNEATKGNPPSRYLQAQVTGGQRLLKPFENRLAAQGILPSGMQAVPGKGAPLDAYGNVPGRLITQILSQLRAQNDPLQNQTDTSVKRRRARKSNKRGEMFALKKGRGRLLPGVYERFKFGAGTILRSLLLFVKPAKYRVRYRIFDIAERLAASEFKVQFETALARALETSKLRGKR